MTPIFPSSLTLLSIPSPYHLSILYPNSSPEPVTAIRTLASKALPPPPQKGQEKKEEKKKRARHFLNSCHDSPPFASTYQPLTIVICHKAGCHNCHFSFLHSRLDVTAFYTTTTTTARSNLLLDLIVPLHCPAPSVSTSFPSLQHQWRRLGCYDVPPLDRKFGLYSV